jgi:hypothetical protein
VARIFRPEAIGVNEAKRKPGSNTRRGVDRETAQKVADQMTMGKDDAILILDDNRISIAAGEEPADVRELNAVYAGAHASEVTDADEREE